MTQISEAIALALFIAVVWGWVFVADALRVGQ